MARILNFGSLNIDYVYRVDRFLQPGETKASRSLTINCGGKGLNQSIACARAGLSVTHAGLLGRDGQILYDKLAENGVDLSLMEKIDMPSGNAIIQVDDAGQNCILLYGGANHAYTEDYIDRTLASFGSGGLALMQNETNLVGSIIEKAHAKGLVTALNASPFDESVLAFPLDQLDWLLVNEIEGARIAGGVAEAEVLATLHARYPRLNVLLTLGKRGSVCLYGENIYRCGSYRVQAVDTTAAGDTFTGYFLAGVLGGLPMEETLERASAASALAVQKLGAASSVPLKRETERARAEHLLGEIEHWGGWR